MTYDPLTYSSAPPLPPPPDDPRGPRDPGVTRGPLGPLGSLVVRKAADITPTVVRWLWDQRIAYGKLNVLGGAPGIGKSYITCALAAAVSCGRRMPGDERPDTTPQRVLLLSYEDDPEDTLRPRLGLLDANLDLVEIVEGIEQGEGRTRAFSVEDVRTLGAYIARAGQVGLVVIDPVSAFVGAGTDEHRGNEVRAALEDLRVLAQAHGFAVLLLMHTRKALADTALNRLSGSQAYGALVRSALMAGPIPDEDGRYALAHVKHNVAAKQPTLAYSVGEDGLTWHGEVDLDGEEVAGNDDGGHRTAGDEARTFLLELLADGSVPASQAWAEADELGIAVNTLKRAKKSLGVVSERGDGAWSWKLPTPPRDPRVPSVDRGTLGPLGTQPSRSATCVECDEPSTATDVDGAERCDDHVSWNRGAA